MRTYLGHSKHSKYKKAWARQALQRLRLELGGLCNNCGLTLEEAEEDGEILEFDCIIPQGHKHHRGSTDQRHAFYRKQQRLGNLQLLCEDCHSHKTRRDMKCPDLIFLANTDNSMLTNNSGEPF